MDRKKILVYGYGNPGRGDDGLGPALVGRIESEGIPGVDTDSNYQLNIEDSLALSSYETVIFADASLDGEGAFSFTPLEPSMNISFTTHAMDPGSVLALCEELYGKRVRAFMLAIRGFCWDFHEGLSTNAEENLEAALIDVRAKIRGLQSGFL